MSLVIDTRLVVEVLLADGWHKVTDGSFDTDAYEIGINVPDTAYSSGLKFVVQHNGGTGFEFMSDDGLRYQGPISAVLALKSREHDE